MRYIILLILLCSCTNNTKQTEMDANNFGRFIDKEYNIVCYHYFASGANLSCIQLTKENTK